MLPQARRRELIAAIVFPLLGLLLLACSTGLGNAGLQEEHKGDYGEQLWLIPSPHGAGMMRTIVFKPSGRGPFPLAIVNHGSHEDPRRRPGIEISSFLPITNWLTYHGYVVALLERPGHGLTGGAYIESAGDCDAADFRAAGLATASAIRQALDYLQTLDFVQRGQAIVIGHSAGGWGVIALASQRPPDVSAIIAFAAGRGGHAYGKANTNCRTDRLIEAARSFGESVTVPSLWLYSENDSYFGPKLARSMFSAFAAGGSEAEFHLLPPLNKYDGHFLMFAATRPWESVLIRFLARKAGAKLNSGPEGRHLVRAPPRQLMQRITRTR
jgi:dienelactone hydrolase